MPLCDERVFKRDTYRRTGRGPSGFEMHYTECRCTRQALPEKTKCWQHDPETRNARQMRSHHRRMDTKLARARARNSTAWWHPK